jgi:hypothetical protein
MCLSEEAQQTNLSGSPPHHSLPIIILIKLQNLLDLIERFREENFIYSQN